MDEVPESVGGPALAGETGSITADRMSVPTPLVTKPEAVSRPEMTIVLRSHSRGDQSSDVIQRSFGLLLLPEVETIETIPEVETAPEVKILSEVKIISEIVVVPAETFIAEVTEGMSGHVTARQEVEITPRQ